MLRLAEAELSDLRLLHQLSRWFLSCVRQPSDVDCVSFSVLLAQRTVWVVETVQFNDSFTLRDLTRSRETQRWCLRFCDELQHTFWSLVMAPVVCHQRSGQFIFVCSCPQQ